MKKSDMTMIIIVAAISMMVAFFVARAIFGDVHTESVKVKTIERFSPEIDQPSEDIFNEDAINPAVQVQITGTK